MPAAGRRGGLVSSITLTGKKGEVMRIAGIILVLLALILSIPSIRNAYLRFGATYLVPPYGAGAALRPTDAVIITVTFDLLRSFMLLAGILLLIFGIRKHREIKSRDGCNTREQVAEGDPPRRVP
jgi:hypothetical protein